MENEKYESIKSKIRKLHALAEKGSYGEMRNAKILIDKLCRQYNLTLEDILNVELKKLYIIRVGARKLDMDLFMQCYSKVTGEDTLQYYQRGRAEIEVNLTPYQYAELLSLYEWHKSNIKRDIDECLKTLLISYCLKHNLDSGKSDDTQERTPLTPEQKRRLASAIMMANNLNDNKYCKLLKGSEEEQRE